MNEAQIFGYVLCDFKEFEKIFFWSDLINPI